MKKSILAITTILLSVVMSAQVKMPAPSPTQTIKQEFGLGSVELTYSRPALKGRTIVGGQDPWDIIWRTGANAATKIKFTDQVTIGGKLLDTGTYVIYTIPHKNADWDVIINKGLKNWGTDGYKETEDVVRFKAPYKKVKKQKVESFTMQFTDVMPESMNCELTWDNWNVTFPITTNVKDKLRTQLEAALQGEKKPYWNAANFYYEWDKDYAKALDNVNKAIEGNAKGFWMYLLKAKVLKEMGNNADAKIAATTCLTLATEAKNDSYVNQAKTLIGKL
jgi:hypothetical protein